MPGNKQITAFVFAGGGSLGAIRVGALRELVAAGEKPDFVVGASVGALNACHYASEPDAAGVKELETIWRNLRRQDVFPATLSGAINLLRGSGSLFDSRSLRQLVTRHLRVERLEDTEIPVHVVATGMDGSATCLSKGAVSDAVLASSAIPIALPSVQIGEHHLIDGAVAGNTPILTAAELGAERIVVLQTGYPCAMQGPPRGAIAGGLHALTLLISNQMERDLKLLAGKADVFVAPHLCPLAISPFNFSEGATLIERSAQAARAWIEAGGLIRPADASVFEHHHAKSAAT